jgi:hypothetical protein
MQVEPKFAASHCGHYTLVRRSLGKFQGHSLLIGLQSLATELQLLATS